ncbi:MAG TPA: NAD(P)/FAD-dependent oxidoreductase [Oscillospiraceae bacterium]|nr:NAD(P)/FAD-dependent oxidoreductase [Oscillospiraceae bacterium]HPK35960.1 NAD(P)/FAD-dependent oxidoreductase [Oscillospiraceae bacterium]HPR76666.1 NAD(P)/FAD-dependent oxidoreductase [Oscillospiraceae bacterium]
MNRTYDAIAVGGGLAGLTAAAYLCRGGHRTLLLEKNRKTGGLVNTFQYRGFAFDAGIRAFEDSGILFPMLKNLGIEMLLVKNPVSIIFENRRVLLTSRESLNDYADALTDLFPENAADIAKIAAEIEKVMDYMDVLYGIDNPLFMENPKPEYLMKTLLPWLLRYQVNIRKASRLNEPIQTYLRRFTDNTALIDMITQHFFKDTPSFFALSYFGLYLDYRYPQGGTGTLAEKVSDYIRTHGGEILTETAVTRVDVEAHELTANGEIYHYQKLVWAADQQTLYQIAEHADTSAEKQRALAEQSEGGDSILTVFMGVDCDKPYFEDRCGAHAFYTPIPEGLSSLPDWRKAAEKGEDTLWQWLEEFLRCTTYEISCPSLRDITLAPDGQTGVIVSTLMDYRLVKHFAEAGKYEPFKQFCTDKILNALESLLPELRQNQLFSMCSTPMTIERETGNKQGAITGWAFTGAMPAENRFQKIANSVNTPLKDVVQCGQWTFSPSGLPVSILTGKLAADAVHKQLKGKTT